MNIWKANKNQNKMFSHIHDDVFYKKENKKPRSIGKYVSVELVYLWWG